MTLKRVNRSTTTEREVVNVIQILNKEVSNEQSYQI